MFGKTTILRLCSLKKGKEVADFEVENALYKRALGYDYEEVKTHIEEVDGKKKKKVEKTHKHIPADVTAQIFWLKNRTNKWRNKDNIEVEKIKAETELIKEKTKAEVAKLEKELKTDTKTEDKLKEYFEALGGAFSEE